MSEIFFKNMRNIVKIRSARMKETSTEILVLLTEAAKDQRVEFISYKKNREIGYIAWLKVNKESAYIFKNTGAIPQLPYEWNEGHIMIVFDVCFVPGWEKLAIKYLKKFLASQRFFLYKRRGSVKAFSRKEKTLRRLAA